MFSGSDIPTGCYGSAEGVLPIFGIFLNVNGMMKLETLFHYYQCSNQFRQGFSVGGTLMKKKIFTPSQSLGPQITF